MYVLGLPAWCFILKNDYIVFASCCLGLPAWLDQLRADDTLGSQAKETTSGTLVKLQVWCRTAAINSRSRTEAIDLAGILCPECRDGVFLVNFFVYQKSFTKVHVN